MTLTEAFFAAETVQYVPAGKTFWQHLLYEGPADRLPLDPSLIYRRVTICGHEIVNRWHWRYGLGLHWDAHILWAYCPVEKIFFYSYPTPLPPKHRRELLVTPEQFKEGYLEKQGMTITRRNFRLLGRLKDGSYVVENPEPLQPYDWSARQAWTQ